jgi:hypothetical protein
MTPSPGLPLAVTHAEIDAAYRSGLAVPLGQAISWLMRYRDAWWVVYERGWLRVTDELIDADLDQFAARLTATDAAAARDTAVRGALGLTPGQDPPAEPDDGSQTAT